jgi:hypothetical protein
MPSKFAVLVGCNYEGSKYPLRGCINDVNGMKVRALRALPGAQADAARAISSCRSRLSPAQEMLKAHFGFEDDHMFIMIDTGEAMPGLPLLSRLPGRDRWPRPRCPSPRPPAHADQAYTQPTGANIKVRQPAAADRLHA